MIGRGSKDLYLVVKYFDFLPHFSRALCTGLNEVHTLVTFILYNVVQLGKLPQPIDKRGDG